MSKKDFFINMNVTIAVAAALICVLGIWDIVDVSWDVLWKIFLTFIILFLCSVVVTKLLEMKKTDSK